MKRSCWFLIVNFAMLILLCLYLASHETFCSSSKLIYDITSHLARPSSQLYAVCIVQCRGTDVGTAILTTWLHRSPRTRPARGLTASTANLAPDDLHCILTWPPSTNHPNPVGPPVWSTFAIRMDTTQVGTGGVVQPTMTQPLFLLECCIQN